jgi:AraC family transcriptional regulator of adaptative response/methylated-DNA-[protein]-cysteine methyltransferase
METCINTGDKAVAGKVSESIFSQSATQGAKKMPISLFVRGTNFQVQVWQALLQISQGSLSTYSDITAAVGKHEAARAAGSAIGAYRWGTSRKHAIPAQESASAI